jgi:hypothetical protein
VVSLLNGLSQLGAGTAAFAATAGLEQQKAALAQQQTILADHLATVRETGLEGQRETFQTGENVANRAATQANLATSEAGANTRSAATNATSVATTGMTVAGEMARTQAQIGADSPEMKLLRELGALPPKGTSSGGSASTGGAPSASSGSTSGGTLDYSTQPFLGGQKTPVPGSADNNPAWPGQTEGPPGSKVTPPNLPGTTSTTAAPPVDPMTNPIVNKFLGYPAAGSEDALRRAVAADVKNDPDFRYKTAGQQATETELRVNVAKGTMTSPATQAANAAMIASYQIKPPDGFALSRPGAAETMAMVTKFNPGYQESRFPEINKAMSAFGSGKQGDIVRSLDVGVQHLDVIDQAASNLGNTNVAVVNTVKNAFQRQFGSPAPTTFDGLKQIVATEVEKAVAGGIGSAGDRDRLMAALNSANSPAQLQAMTDGFRALMAGQLSGLKTQYENDTGFKAGPFAFENKLGPETLKTLAAHSGSGSTGATQPANPNIIRYDASGNRVAQ